MRTKQATHVRQNPLFVHSTNLPVLVPAKSDLKTPPLNVGCKEGQARDGMARYRPVGVGSRGRQSFLQGAIIRLPRYTARGLRNTKNRQAHPCNPLTQYDIRSRS